LNKTVSLARAPILVLWAILLSAFTAVLGAAPLRVLRELIGHNLFWLVGTILAAAFFMLGWYPLSAVIAVQFILIGSYAEFEDRDFTLRQAAGLSVLLTALFLTSCFYTWTAFTGKGWLAQVVQYVQTYLDKARALNMQFLAEVKAQEIVVQIPSAIVIFLILSLGLGLIFEKSVSAWAQVQATRREKLSDYTIPEFMVWVLIFALLGAFAQHGVKVVEAVSLNLLNISIVAYFFQGLAVLGKYFETFKVGPFWRVMWVLVLVVQLPILMSLVGLVDYWADFRQLFIKKAAELKKKRQV